jgi:hypothetical protein
MRINVGEDKTRFKRIDTKQCFAIKDAGDELQIRPGVTVVFRKDGRRGCGKRTKGRVSGGVFDVLDRVVVDITGISFKFEFAPVIFLGDVTSEKSLECRVMLSPISSPLGYGLSP